MARPRGALMRCTPEPNNPSAYRGAAAVTLSMRSNRPPCPGRIAPLSLSPAARLNMLSVRSPMMEKIPTAQPNATGSKRRQAEMHRTAPGHQRHHREAAERSLPGLAGTDARRQFSPSKTASGEVRADVGGDHQQHQPQHDLRTARNPVRRSQQPRQRNEGRHQHGYPAEQRERPDDAAPAPPTATASAISHHTHAASAAACRCAGSALQRPRQQHQQRERPRRTRRGARRRARAPKPAHSQAPTVNTTPNASHRPGRRQQEQSREQEAGQDAPQ